MNRYNKKYRLENIKEFHRHNPVYDCMKDSICYLAYFKVRERGLFLYLDHGWFGMPQRVHTSTVTDVEYYDGGEKIVVTTENTELTFTLIMD